MADYISRDKINEAFDSIWDCADMVFEPDDHCCAADDCGHCKWLQTKNAIKKKLDHIQPADVRPVVRAHWEWDENGMDWNLGAWKCSRCHCKAETWWATDKHNPLYCAGSHFCGNCGADMREVKADG